jgi:hypothetical protein
LVQQLFDLLEFLARQSSRMNAFDLPSKVFKLGWVCGWWEGKGKGFDGHYTLTDNDTFKAQEEICPHVTEESRATAQTRHAWLSF